MKEKKENVSVIVSFIIVIGLIVLVVISLLNKPAKTEMEENVLGGLPEEQIINNNIGDVAVTPTNNMEEQNTKVAKSGDTLVMNYTGRFTDGTVFDSNIDPKFKHVQPFEFKLGAGQVIKGWDEGLVGMKVGEKKTLTVPPEKGYGPNDYSGIPGNSTLIFDVELVSIK